MIHTISTQLMCPPSRRHIHKHTHRILISCRRRVISTSVQNYSLFGKKKPSARNDAKFPNKWNHSLIDSGAIIVTHKQRTMADRMGGGGSMAMLRLAPSAILISVLLCARGAFADCTRSWRCWRTRRCARTIRTSASAAADARRPIGASRCR